jgi:transposase
MGYDKVLRERAVFYRGKHRQKETCQAFGVSAGALKKWQKQYKETGSLKNKPLQRKWRKTDPQKLIADVDAHPDDFNDERAERFGCSGEAIRQALQKLIITRKKRVLPTAKSLKKNVRNI